MYVYNSRTRLVLNVSYNGKIYHGFQKQSGTPHVATVQGTIESALLKLFPVLTNKKPPLTIGSGRTDKEVHANEQVVAVLLTSDTLKMINKLGLATLVTLLNRELPQDIRILGSYLVGDDFNPRYAGVVRCYRYQILQVEQKPKKNVMPYNSFDFSQETFYHVVHYHIDLDLLESYFKYFIGTHNFTSFSSWSKEYESGKTNSQNPIRSVYSVDLIPKGRQLWIDIYANSFLKSMVRSMVGNVLYCYERKDHPSVIAKILLQKDNQFAKKRAPAHALFLRRVYFCSLFQPKP